MFRSASGLKKYCRQHVFITRSFTCSRNIFYTLPLYFEVFQATSKGLCLGTSPTNKRTLDCWFFFPVSTLPALTHFWSILQMCRVMPVKWKSRKGKVCSPVSGDDDSFWRPGRWSNRAFLRVASTVVITPRGPSPKNLSQTCRCAQNLLSRFVGRRDLNYKPKMK